jgi:hypothetical protein
MGSPVLQGGMLSRSHKKSVHNAGEQKNLVFLQELGPLRTPQDN